MFIRQRTQPQSVLLQFLSDPFSFLERRRARKQLDNLQSAARGTHSLKTLYTGRSGGARYYVASRH